MGKREEIKRTSSSSSSSSPSSRFFFRVPSNTFSCTTTFSRIRAHSPLAETQEQGRIRDYQNFFGQAARTGIHAPLPWSLKYQAIATQVLFCDYPTGVYLHALKSSYQATMLTIQGTPRVAVMELLLRITMPLPALRVPRKEERVLPPGVGLLPARQEVEVSLFRSLVQQIKISKQQPTMGDPMLSIV